MLLNRVKIANYLKEYVFRKNLKLLLVEEVSLPHSLTELVDLIVRDGDNIIFFSILSQKVLSDPQLRKLIYLEVAKLSKLTNYANKVYLVLPKEYVKPTILDGKVFEDIGIGLISVSVNGTIEEIIPARPFERVSFTSTSRDLEKKILALEERISRIEKNINAYREEINSIINSVRNLTNQLAKTRNEINSIKATMSSIAVPTRAEVIIGETEERVTVNAGEELPSFVKDNPWLVELSKRSKGD